MIGRIAERGLDRGGMPARSVPHDVEEQKKKREMEIKGQEAERIRRSAEWLKKQIEDGNRFIERLAKIKYEYDYYDKPPKRIIVRIVNRETGKVIREIPPEKFLKFITRLIELAGIMFDEEA